MRMTRQQRTLALSLIQSVPLALLLLLFLVWPDPPEPPRQRDGGHYATAEERTEYDRNHLRDLLEAQREAATSRPG